MSDYPTTPEYLTVAEAAALLRVPASAVYTMITDGRLVAGKPGREYRIHRDAVRAAMGADRLNVDEIDRQAEAITAAVLENIGAIFGRAARTIELHHRVSR